MNRTLKIVAIMMLALLVSMMWFATGHGVASQSPKVHASLPMTFAHADHSEQQCVSCHHNYQDDSGKGLCIECHHSDPRVVFKVREQFHELCMGCHLKLREDGEDTGPLRSCKACHTEDQRP